MNDAPTVAIALTDRSSAEDTAIDFTVPAGSFVDVDSATLVYSARMAAGSVLPSWLNFDAAAGRFTGTPPLNFNGFVDIEVTASDGLLSASDIFRLAITPVNDAPLVTVLLPDASVASGSAVNYTVASGSFTEADGDALSYSANLASGAVLPAWLLFNATTRTFTGTPPSNATGAYDIQVTASDGSLIASDIFRLTVTGLNIIIGTNNPDTLNGTAGADQIFGLLGNDSITAGDGNDI